MTNLRQIHLYLDGRSKVERDSFLLCSRYICNYLEQKLADNAYETTFHRINIHCSDDCRETVVEPIREPKGFLQVNLDCDLPPLLSLDQKSLQMHYFKIIELGLKEASAFTQVPFDFCMKVLNRFELEGSKNTWTQVDRIWKRSLYRSIIEAELTIDSFCLRQSVFHADKLLTNEKILETQPRELIFYDFLGKLKLFKKDYITYESRNGILISKFSIKDNCFTEKLMRPSDTYTNY